MKKKVIIVCGPDNCGKDTLIGALKATFNNPIILHAGVPDMECNSLFDYYYKGILDKTLDALYDKDHDAIIHNRSMYGEYVYGPKYRNESSEKIRDIILKLETGLLKTYIRSEELYFILLTSSNVKLLLNNDDGKSLSNKEVDIADEIRLFDEVFELSNIKNKLRLYVNSGDLFRNKDDIFDEAITFINS